VVSRFVGSLLEVRLTKQEAIQELITTGKASPKAQEALFEAGLVEWDPFRNQYVPTNAGRIAVRGANGGQ
jgi:hypothetical protein